ncbi:MAG: MBL fold metallo-hydrolase, partial [Chloroflexi bacterium]|nr:MBL fold metallo-hydrolase [Chloroflexota bacterium]
TIDLVVLSHPQADHTAGLLEVLQRYRVEQVLYPAVGEESLLSDRWLGLIGGKGIRSTIARAGQRMVLSGGVIIEVLNPPASLSSDAESDPNNEAVVLRVSFGKVSFLLTGDIMRAAELELIMRRADLASTVLKVAHHGSDTSTTPEFLAVVAPHLAVISAGKDNRFGHPGTAVLDRLVEEVGRGNVFRTDEDGNVEFITDGEKLWVKVGS